MRLIDGEELYDRYRGIDGREEEYVGNLRQRIMLMPTVDAAPVVHARWIMRPYYDDGDPDGGGEIVCSNCGERSPIHLDEDQYETPYCKDCGAKMDGEKEARGDV